MFNHEPAGYECPFCRLIAGEDDAINAQADIVARTGRATAFVAPRWWPRNHGHVLVVPNAHLEHLYDLTPDDGHAVHDLVREVAIAMRATYGCAGVSTRQHNEPAGYQDVWHHHVHVFPRYPGDELYRSDPEPGFVSAERRRPYAERLRHRLAVQTTRATYDEIADDYRQRSRAPFGALAAQIAGFLDRLPTNALVADVGCGPGRDTELLRQQGLTVLGLDLSAGMLRIGGLTDVVQADMRAMPLATASLDGVWSHAALLHLPLADVPMALAEFGRVVRPGGALHLAVAEGDGEGYQTDLYGGRARWFSHHREEELVAALTSAGFTTVEVARASSHRDWLTVDAIRDS